MEIKIGETQKKKAVRDICKSDELKVLLRVVWKNKSDEVAFNPTEDIKAGDEIKVTVVKVSDATKTDDDKKGC